MKQEKSRLRCGSRKGFIISLDLFLGFVLFSIMLLVTVLLINVPSTTFSDYEMQETGGDIVIMLDQLGYIRALDDANIKTTLDVVVPTRLGMMVRLEGNFTLGNGTLDIGDDLPSNYPIITSEYVSVTNSNEYVHVTYYVWSERLR